MRDSEHWFSQFCKSRVAGLILLMLLAGIQIYSTF